MLKVVFSWTLMFLTATRGAAGADNTRLMLRHHAEDASNLASEQSTISSPHLLGFLPSVLVVVVTTVVVNMTTNETEM